MVDESRKKTLIFLLTRTARGLNLGGLSQSKILTAMNSLEIDEKLEEWDISVYDGNTLRNTTIPKSNFSFYATKPSDSYEVDPFQKNTQSSLRVLEDLFPEYLTPSNFGTKVIQFNPIQNYVPFVIFTYVTCQSLLPYSFSLFAQILLFFLVYFSFWKKQGVFKQTANISTILLFVIAISLATQFNSDSLIFSVVYLTIQILLDQFVYTHPRFQYGVRSLLAFLGISLSYIYLVFEGSSLSTMGSMAKTIFLFANGLLLFLPLPFLSKQVRSFTLVSAAILSGISIALALISNLGSFFILPYLFLCIFFALTHGGSKNPTRIIAPLVLVFS
jgi:hypothetical protein